MVRDRLALGMFALLPALVLALPAAAQTSASPPAQKPASTPPRTADGKPNLEGIFSYSTITPLQRPDALAGKDTLSDAEAAEFEPSPSRRGRCPNAAAILRYRLHSASKKPLPVLPPT